MAHVKDRSRGQSSRAKRVIRQEMFEKTLHRNQNQTGCTARNLKKNSKRN
jgi:hypothetical protein